MALNGSQTEYSSARVHGFTDRNISTDMSTIISTTARAIMARFRSEAQLLPNTTRSFMAKRCMTLTATKRLVDADNI